jgi:hypothetical protein
VSWLDLRLVKCERSEQIAKVPLMFHAVLVVASLLRGVRILEIQNCSHGKFKIAAHSV